MKKTACVLLCLFALLILNGCQKVVTNTADELTLSSWACELENGNTISLEFNGNIATMNVTSFGSQTASISGLCELSEKAFVIHDEKTKTPYAFSYVVHFDRVEIVYKENTVVLYKS